MKLPFIGGMSSLSIQPFLLTPIVGKCLKFILQKCFRDCTCPRAFEPICATDGQMYENSCFLNCTKSATPGLQVDYHGPCCPSAELCQTYFDPVCDNYGTTHPNECVFNHRKCVEKRKHAIDLRVESQGRCKKGVDTGRCAMFCNETWEPLCDTYGRTHKNKCKFELANCRLSSRHLQPAQIAYFGACNRTATLVPQIGHVFTVAPTVHTPEEETHSETKNVTEASNFTESHETRNDTISALIPIDGGLNVTDSTEDELALQSVGFGHDEPPTRLNYDDASEPPSANEKPRAPATAGKRVFCKNCDDETDIVPVCDNANGTHQSICLFAQWNCERRQLGLEERILVHIGECDDQSPSFTLENEVCPKKCSKQYKPICDSSGVTHPNLCTFQIYNCRLRKMNKVDEVSWLRSLHECNAPAKTTASTKAMKPVKSNTTTPTTTHPSRKQEQFECPKPRCSHERNPTCDNEGTIHKNECLFAHARCLAAKEGRVLRPVAEEECTALECRKLLESPNKCNNSDYDPICGSDFNKYSNNCFFRRAQCASSDLEQLFKGDCKQCFHSPCPPVNPDTTDDDSLFLCDQSAETKSKCEFEMLRCVYEIKYGYNITPAYEGKCCPEFELCPSDVDTICDSRGTIHRNPCHFAVHECRALKIEKVDPPVIVGKMCAGNATTSVQTAMSISEEKREARSDDESQEGCNAAECSSKFEPVCGSDGTTYKNRCEFEQARCNGTWAVELEYEGECCRRDCPPEYEPVCDNHDKTHLNLCEFGYQRCVDERTGSDTLSVASYSACHNSSCDKPCSSDFKPVCALNGKIYPNRCALDKARCLLNNPGNLNADYDGECCPSVSECDLTEFKPLCDSTGRTHANQCVFGVSACLMSKRSNTSLDVAHSGECCKKECSETGSPVCGGNITYPSMCHFRVKQCEAEKRGVLLTLVHPGECCTKQTGQCEQSGPLCDSDGQTHGNRCSFDHKKCVMAKSSKATLPHILHTGTCCELETCDDRDAQPVCDSRRVTHKNLCHFKNAKCVSERLHPDMNITLAYKGACCPHSCDDQWKPVCDQGGTLYRNKCHFELRSCEANRRSETVPNALQCVEGRNTRAQ